MAMKLQPIPPSAYRVAQGPVGTGQKCGSPQAGISNLGPSRRKAIWMNAAAQLVIGCFEVASIDFEEARQLQRREQINVSGERGPTLKTYEARFLTPRT